MKTVAVLTRFGPLHWISDLGKMAAFRGIRFKLIDLMELASHPEEVNDCAAVWLFHSLEEYKSGVPPYFSVLQAVEKDCVDKKKPFLNSTDGILHTSKSSLYTRLLNEDLPCPKFWFDPGAYEAVVSMLGSPFLFRDDLSHMGRQLFLIEDKEGYETVRNQVSPAVAIEFIETADEYDYRQCYRYIVCGNRAVFRHANANKGFKFERTFDGPFIREFEEESSKQTLPFASDCIHVMHSLGLKIGAVDFLLPDGFAGKPVFIDVTTTFAMWKPENFKSPWLYTAQWINNGLELVLNYLCEVCECPSI